MDKFSVIDIKTGFEMLPYTSIQTAAYENICSEFLHRKEKDKECLFPTFEEDGHIYKLNGVVIPSVTKILQLSGIADFSTIPIWHLEPARQFGLAVHKACELYDLGKLDERNLDPALWPYLDAWIAYQKAMDIKEFLAIEHPIVSVNFKVAGTPDRIAPSDKRRRFGILLQPEGTFKITEYKDKNDWQVFLAALSIVNWKARNK